MGASRQRFSTSGQRPWNRQPSGGFMGLGTSPPRGFAMASNPFSTEGTAAMMKSVGLDVRVINKKLSEGHPNAVDIINDGTVSGVVNTITGGRVPLRDGFEIRRAAAEKRIPCFTSLDTARAAVEALSNGGQTYSAQPVFDYREKEPK